MRRSSSGTSRSVIRLACTIAVAAGCVGPPPDVRVSYPLPPTEEGVRRTPNESAELLLGGELHGTLDGVELANVARVQATGEDSVVLWVPSSTDHGIISVELRQLAEIMTLAPGMSLSVTARGCSGATEAACVPEEALTATVRVEAGEAPLLRHVVLSTQWAAGRGHVDGAFNFRATGTAVIVSAGMQGEMGEISASDVATTSYVGNALQLDVHQNSSHGWIMVRLNLEEPLESLVVGSQASSPSVGCSGPTDGNFTFDSSSSAMNVHVEPTDTPGVLRLTFVGTWMNESTPQNVTGTVDYRLPQ